MKIVIAGASKDTNLNDLVELTRMSKMVEIILEYSNERESRQSNDFLIKAARALSTRFVLKIVGETAKKELKQGLLDDFTMHASRVQVEGTLSIDDTLSIAKQVPQLVTQHSAENASLVGLACQNHQILLKPIDGIEFVPLSTPKPIGFASNVHSESLYQQIPKLKKLAGDKSWLEVSNGLYENHHFSVDKARLVILEFLDITQSQTNEPIVEKKNLQPAA